MSHPFWGQPSSVLRRGWGTWRIIWASKSLKYVENWWNFRYFYLAWIYVLKKINDSEESEDCSDGYDELEDAQEALGNTILNEEEAEEESSVQREIKENEDVVDVQKYLRKIILSEENLQEESAEQTDLEGNEDVEDVQEDERKMICEEEPGERDGSIEQEDKK